jgi:hypothetical protein
MASLVDLFNPTFLMFLGILVLVVALLVVYFESKMREQNHKIASMLSLVSTLAEDMNGVKMGINHLAVRDGHYLNVPLREDLGNIELVSNNLIEVSDGEESEEDDDENEDLEEDSESDSGSESESDSESDSTEDIKIVKLQVSDEDLQDDESYEETNNLEFDIDEELDADLVPEITNNYIEEVLELKYDIEPESEPVVEESVIPSSSDLKTISINLGEENLEDNIDYKKLQLQKLRSIVVEKGLTNNSEASKLKKPELLKLLGAE